MIIAPTPSAIPVKPSIDMAHFATKYGYHGTLMAIRDKSNALMEVMQLNFSLIFHSGKEVDWSKVRDISTEEITRYAIPKEEMIRYSRALWENDLWEAVSNGANYSLPVGLKRWVETSEPEWAALKQLPVLDYT